MVSDAIRPLPPFAALAERQAAIADLVADAAAVDALGDATPLASALLHFDERGGGVAPERVDRLVGTGPAETVSSALLVAAAVALAGIAALVAPMLLLGWHPDLALPIVIEPAGVDHRLRSGVSRGPSRRPLPAPLAADLLLCVVVGPTTGHRKGRRGIHE